MISHRFISFAEIGNSTAEDVGSAGCIKRKPKPPIKNKSLGKSLKNRYKSGHGAETRFRSGNGRETTFILEDDVSD